MLKNMIFEDEDGDEEAITGLVTEKAGGDSVGFDRVVVSMIAVEFNVSGEACRPFFKRCLPRSSRHTR